MALEVGKGVKEKKVTKKDFQKIGEHIVDLYSARKNKLEKSGVKKQRDEVDRQVEMRPETLIKRKADGTTDKHKKWMSELEIQNQRQALEMLNADSRRLLWPDTGSWFEANAEVTDEYLREVEDLPLISGDENETRSSVNQDIANEITEAWLLNIHRSYDFRRNVDIINAEAFKYGDGIGRLKMVDSPLGIKIPRLVPVPLKQTFLPDEKFHLQNEGVNIDPGIIRRYPIAWEDLKIAAEKGENDPDKPEGGWMKDNLAPLQTKNNEPVVLLEFEGDLVVPRSSDSLVAKGVIVTVGIGGEEGKDVSVVRFRNRQLDRSSYFIFSYHVENMGSAYSVGPLMMGRTLQSAASFALNRSMDAATYATDPHLFYDSDDPQFQASGGPNLSPGGSTGTTGEIREVSPGDPASLFNIYIATAAQHSELLGMTSARLGAQTVSHTTAFAKDQEIARGQVRTVDYVKSIMSGPLREWLDTAYKASLEALGDKTVPVFMHKSRAYINLSKGALPKNVFFEIFGAAGPAEDTASQGNKVNALQSAASLEFARRQLGEAKQLDLTKVQEELLRIGGLIDVDKFYVEGGAGTPPGTAEPSLVGGAGQGGNQNALPAIVQTLQSGG